MGYNYLSQFTHLVAELLLEGAITDQFVAHLGKGREVNEHGCYMIFLEKVMQHYYTKSYSIPDRKP